MGTRSVLSLDQGAISWQRDRAEHHGNDNSLAAQRVADDSELELPLAEFGPEVLLAINWQEDATAIYCISQLREPTHATGQRSAVEENAQIRAPLLERLVEGLFDPFEPARG